MNRKARRAAEFGNSLTSGFSPKRQEHLDLIAGYAEWDLPAQRIFIQHQLDATVEDSIDKDKFEIQIYQYPPLAH